MGNRAAKNIVAMNIVIGFAQFYIRPDTVASKERIDLFCIHPVLYSPGYNEDERGENITGANITMYTII